MSASKKTTSKATKSPAPATKSTKAKPAAKKKAAVETPSVVPTPVVAPVPSPAPAVVPAVKPIPCKPMLTTISARVDVGFGNTLYLRGEGPGLSWDRGLAMENLARDLWQIVLAESARPYTFKLLINDVTWNVGPDFIAASGTHITLTPRF